MSILLASNVESLTFFKVMYFGNGPICRKSKIHSNYHEKGQKISHIIFTE